MDLGLICGIIGGVIGVGVYFPQIIKLIQTKSSKNVSVWTYVILWFNALFWTAYGIYINNAVIYIPNGIDIFLPLYIIGLIKKYSPKF